MSLEFYFMESTMDRVCPISHYLTETHFTYSKVTNPSKHHTLFAHNFQLYLFWS